MFSFLVLVRVVKTLNIYKQSAKDVLRKILFWKSMLYKYWEPVAKINENKRFPFHRNFFFSWFLKLVHSSYFFFFSSSIYLLFQNKMFFVCNIWHEPFMFYFLFNRMYKIHRKILLVRPGHIHGQRPNLMGLYSGGLYTEGLHSERETLQFAVC